MAGLALRQVARSQACSSTACGRAKTSGCWWALPTRFSPVDTGASHFHSPALWPTTHPYTSHFCFTFPLSLYTLTPAAGTSAAVPPLQVRPWTRTSMPGCSFSGMLTTPGTILSFTYFRFLLILTHQLLRDHPVYKYPCLKTPTQGLNPGLLHCRQIPYQLSYQESQHLTEVCLKKTKLFFYGGLSKIYLTYLTWRTKGDCLGRNTYSETKRYKLNEQRYQCILWK